MLTIRAEATPQHAANAPSILHARQVDRVSRVKRLRMKRKTVHFERLNTSSSSIRLV